MRLRAYRFEPLVLLLVALAALVAVNVSNPEDGTRYELTRHLVLRHSLEVEPQLFDRAVYGGRTYSDKAPGMSFLAVPAYQVERTLGVARAPKDWEREGDLSLWGIHVATSGLLFLLATLLVGRAAETLVPRTGAATAATFGTATIAAPLAPTLFEHDAAGCLALAGLLCAWRCRRRALLALAGLLLGIGVLFAYEVAVAAVAVALYVAVRERRRVAWLLLGAVPPAVALGAYNWSAFGSPFHLSYRYVANRFALSQHHGFFGIGVPTLTGLRDALVFDRGLLVWSPVLVAAAVGLVVMWRRGYRGESLVAAVVVVAFVVGDAAYFLPYGGNSPGPRFAAPALPLLLLGLPFALARFPRTTLALAAVSAVLTTAQSLTWALRRENDRWYPGSGYSDLAKTVWVWLGVENRLVGAGLALLCAVAAIAVGAWRLLGPERARAAVRMQPWAP